MLITEENFDFALVCLEANDEIGADTETSGLNVRTPGADYLMGFCFDVEGFGCYMPFRHPEGNLPLRYLDRLRPLLYEKDLIWHNRKFDMHSVTSIGINPLEFKGKQYDTMMIATLVNEELYSKELDFLAKWYLKEEKYESDKVHKMGEAFGFANLPPQVYERYGPQDARLTRLLKGVLWPKLLSQELEGVYWDTEAPFTELLYRIERRGVGTNRDFAHRRAVRGRGRMATITRELKLNPASPIALGKYLLEELGLPVLAHTKSCEQCKFSPVDQHKGPPSFNKLVMEEYDELLQASSNPAARRIAEYRGWQKAVTSLYEPMLEKADIHGIIRTEFKQHGTVTGRLSSHDPNLQQIPRSSPKPWNGDAKSAFNSGIEDFDLIGWDYSQLELRLGAAYGEETLLLTEFAKPDADPFKVLTPGIFGEYSEELRHKTKNCFVYPSLYGAGVKKVALVLGRSLEDTKPLYANYKATISGITEVSDRVTKLVEQRGYVRYWDGRRRHIRNKGDAYKAWNSVLQGGGAQLVKQAMLRCLEFEDENCFMVLQVHDEITFAIRKGMRHIYEPLIVKAMTDWPQFNVNFAVEGKVWK